MSTEPFQSCCPTCLTTMNKIVGVGGAPPMPRAGQISMCATCGNFSMFDEDIKLRVMTIAEEQTVSHDPTYHILKQMWEDGEKQAAAKWN